MSHLFIFFRSKCPSEQRFALLREDLRVRTQECLRHGLARAVDVSPSPYPGVALGWWGHRLVLPQLFLRPPPRDQAPCKLDALWVLSAETGQEATHAKKS